MRPDFNHREAGYTILPGRFQPPHNDHVALVREVATTVPPPLYLGLIVHAPDLAADPDAHMGLDSEARQHNQPERNPFTFAERHAMWQYILARELADVPAPIILALPRPESAWSWITSVFPGQRTWIVPDCGEAFDDMKARFLSCKGDRVARVAQRPTTDGRQVRALLGDPARLATHVPPSVAACVAAFNRFLPAKEIPCRLVS